MTGVLLVRHLDADRRFSGNRRFNADFRGGQIQLDVVLKTENPADLHALLRLKLVTRDGGTPAYALEPDIDAEVTERLLKLLRGRHQSPFGVLLRGAAPGQEGDRRKGEFLFLSLAPADFALNCPDILRARIGLLLPGGSCAVTGRFFRGNGTFRFRAGRRDSLSFRRRGGRRVSGKGTLHSARLRRRTDGTGCLRVFRSGGRLHFHVFRERSHSHIREEIAGVIGEECVRLSGKFLLFRFLFQKGRHLIFFYRYRPFGGRRQGHIIERTGSRSRNRPAGFSAASEWFVRRLFFRSRRFRTAGDPGFFLTRPFIPLGFTGEAVLAAPRCALFPRADGRLSSFCAELTQERLLCENDGSDDDAADREHIGSDEAEKPEKAPRDDASCDAASGTLRGGDPVEISERHIAADLHRHQLKKSGEKQKQQDQPQHVPENPGIAAIGDIESAAEKKHKGKNIGHQPEYSEKSVAHHRSEPPDDAGVGQRKKHG